MTINVGGDPSGAITAIERATEAINALQGKTIQVTCSCKSAEEHENCKTKARLEAARHGLLLCHNCENEFNPIRTRWLCPYCKTKHSCCEGGPA